MYKRYINVCALVNAGMHGCCVSYCILLPCLWFITRRCASRYGHTRYFYKATLLPSVKLINYISWLLPAALLHLQAVHGNLGILNRGVKLV
jgi:hypothetical protein